MSLEERRAIIAEVDSMQKKTGLCLGKILSFAGLSTSTWNEWHRRLDVETKHNHDTPKRNWTTPKETEAIIKFCTENKDPLRGYRYLTWMMVDMNVAAVLPSTVYNMMCRHELFKKRAAPAESKEKYPDVHARLIHDCGRQFTAKEFIELVGMLDLYETSTSPFHPQSNGKVERFHSTLKTEEVRRTPYFDYKDAKKKRKCV